MQPQKEAHELTDFAIQLAQCKNTFRGRKERKRILRATVKWCAKMICDKRLKGN